jgi:hypothetical protein
VSNKGPANITRLRITGLKICDEITLRDGKIIEATAVLKNWNGRRLDELLTAAALGKWEIEVMK